MYIFLSHASANAKLAEKVCSVIEKTEHRCFMAPRDIRMGHEYAAEIMEGLDNSDAMVLLLSKESVASPHVLREIERAVSKNIPIIVYKYEEVELTKSLEYFLMTHQWITTPKSDYKDILECIETLAAEKKEAMQEGSEQAEVTESTVTSKAKKHNLPIVIALSSVLLAVVIIVASLIIRKAINDKNAGNNTEDDDPDWGLEDIEPDGDLDPTDPDWGLEVTEPEEGTEEEIEEPTEEESHIKVGDRFDLGQYNDEAIEWRVLRILEDGKTAVLISQNILTMKAFDAAESGKGGYYEGKDQYSQDAPANTDLEIQRLAWGDNTWRDSNLRTWLNSTREVVKYEDQPPVSSAFSDRYHDYSTEPGFLHNFNEEELAVLKEVKTTTIGNELQKEAVIETWDKVFLLSTEELAWFDKADIPLFAVPTDSAIEKNQDPTYEEIVKAVYDTDTYFWWLRDPVLGYSGRGCIVNISGLDTTTNDTYWSCVPGIGVRPAIYVDIEKLSEIQ